MSVDRPKKNSRREFIKSAGVSSLGIALAMNNTAHAQTAEPCDPDLIDKPICTANGMFINGQKVNTQTDFGNLGFVRDKHRITVHYFTEPSYVNNTANLENRSFLTVDIGPNTDSGLFYRGNTQNFNDIEELTDLFIFDAGTCQLLYRKEFGGGEKNPSAIVSLDPLHVSQQRNLNLIVRSSKYGLWGETFSLGNTPETYNNFVAPQDANIIFRGSSTERPYIARAATGGQGDLGSLHRPSINIINNNTVRVHLGGDAAGAGKHGAFNNTHYIMGGALFDQNGNELAPQQLISFTDAADQQVEFTGLNLSQRGVRTLRAVMFDTFQGKLMSWVDV